VCQKFDFSKQGYFIHFYFSPDKGASSFRHPCGIFDAFGNILAILSGVATEEQALRIISFIDEISVNKYPLVPAHYPLFPEETFRSGRIHQYRFKEFVGHFHNGGLWSWYTGPYVAALIKVGDRERAGVFLEGIMKANCERKDGMDFYEYHTGKRARIRLKIEHAGGLDLELSLKTAATVRKAKAMVLFHFAGKKTDAAGDIALRALGAAEQDILKATAVGPDAKEVLEKIAGLRDKRGQSYFRAEKSQISDSVPGGAPYLGVSAAAFIIGYKAYFENKIIFE
jgi:phosphotransferase system HPr-like phosphotransfer protein